MNPAIPQDSASTVPDAFPVVHVGITGHRVLLDTVGVSNAIQSVLTGLASTPTGQLGLPRSLVLVSCLAEGADRIAAQEILRRQGGVLRVILPMPPDDYEGDFGSSESCAQFRELLSRAAHVEVVASLRARCDGYLEAGRRLIEACDILLAVWDGRPGRGVGGTADVVALARERDKPLIIIGADDPTRVGYERMSVFGKPAL